MHTHISMHTCTQRTKGTCTQTRTHVHMYTHITQAAHMHTHIHNTHNTHISYTHGHMTHAHKDICIRVRSVHALGLRSPQASLSPSTTMMRRLNDPPSEVTPCVSGSWDLPQSHGYCPVPRGVLITQPCSRHRGQPECPHGVNELTWTQTGM